MTMTKLRHQLYEEMEKHLENMCAYLATGNKQLFHYYAGKADALRDILEEVFNFDERYASNHVKAMWDIMDENW